MISICDELTFELDVSGILKDARTLKQGACIVKFFVETQIDDSELSVNRHLTSDINITLLTERNLKFQAKIDSKIFKNLQQEFQLNVDQEGLIKQLRVMLHDCIKDYNTDTIPRKYLKVTVTSSDEIKNGKIEIIYKSSLSEILWFGFPMQRMNFISRAELIKLNKNILQENEELEKNLHDFKIENILLKAENSRLKEENKSLKSSSVEKEETIMSRDNSTTSARKASDGHAVHFTRQTAISAVTTASAFSTKVLKTTAPVLGTKSLSTQFSTMTLSCSGFSTLSSKTTTEAASSTMTPSFKDLRFSATAASASSRASPAASSGIGNSGQESASFSSLMSADQIVEEIKKKADKEKKKRRHNLKN